MWKRKKKTFSYILSAGNTQKAEGSIDKFRAKLVTLAHQYLCGCKYLIIEILFSQSAILLDCIFPKHIIYRRNCKSDRLSVCLYEL